MSTEPQRNPVLLVTNAGFGETPTPTGAKFHIGQAVEVRRREQVMAAATVIAVVPPLWAPEYALHDALKQPRPLMVSVNRKRSVTYIVRRGDQPEGRYDWVGENWMRAAGAQTKGR